MTTPCKHILSMWLLAAVLTGCGGGDKPAAGPGPGASMPPAEVDVVTVVPGSATYTQDLPGRLEAYRTAQHPMVRYDHREIVAISEHIAEFSLAGIKQLARKAG